MPPADCRKRGAASNYAISMRTSSPPPFCALRLASGFGRGMERSSQPLSSWTNPLGAEASPGAGQVPRSALSSFTGAAGARGRGNPLCNCASALGYPSAVRLLSRFLLEEINFESPSRLVSETLLYSRVLTTLPRPAAALQPRRVPPLVILIATKVPSSRRHVPQRSELSALLSESRNWETRWARFTDVGERLRPYSCLNCMTPPPPCQTS